MNIFDDTTSTGVRTDASELQVLSISDLTKCIKSVIEAEDLFRDIWVRGEVSNLTKHSSGHLYFSLKDENALIRCAMWVSNARTLRCSISNGMSVIAKGRVSIYEKMGQYQLICSEIKPDGVGSLYAAYEQLKCKLQDEGLFDESRKKPIPRFPARIAIVTSPTAAALRDMVSIARRRMPVTDILIVPALMQGAESEASVVESLRIADSLANVDVILLGRGGGSIEDLWTFNSESVVRAIAACKIPVVSAIGHETDYTLADFAADLRAPTPSAAAEMVLPDCKDLSARINGYIEAAAASLAAQLSRKQGSLDLLVHHPSLMHPERMLLERWQTIDLVEARLAGTFRTNIMECRASLAELSSRLDTLSPLGVLSRGYGVVRRSSDGSVVKSVSDVSPSEMTETLLADGRLISEIKEIKEGWD